MIITEDRTDIMRAVVTHSPDGETYIIEYCSLWDEDEKVVGTRIIAAAGPITHRDLLGDDFDFGLYGVPTPREVFTRIADWQDLTDENASWLQTEDEAGKLDYPIGVA